jgi:hypothetical protein
MSLNESIRDRAVLVVLWAALVALVAVQARWPADDTYIHLRIARNVVEHHSLAFNPEAPTFSTTSPLWNLLLAGALVVADALPGPPPDDLAVAQGLNILLALGLLGLFHRLYAPRGPALALLGAAALAVDPYLTYAAAAGMEMTLFALLALATLERKRRWKEGPPPWSLVLLASLLPQTRPEGWVVLAALALDHGWRRERRGAAISLVGRTLLLSLPWFALWQIHLGSILPASILAKSTGTMGRLPLPAKETVRQLARLAVPVYGPFVLVALLAGWWARRRGATPAPAVAARAEILALTGISALYLFMLKESYISSRYLVTLAPFLVGVTVTALAAIRPSSGGLVRVRRPLGPPVLAVLVLMLLAADLYAVPHRNARGRSLEPPRRAAGEWLRAHTPPEAVVYASAIGYIGYFSERTLVGGEGLVDPAGVGARVRRGDLDVAGYLEIVRPDFAVAPGRPHPGALRMADFGDAGTEALSVWKMPWSSY